jgi:hypothetical protein
MKPWIDESHNHDNMLFSIAEGIRKSYFFIVFLTVNLNEKIKRGHEEKEWCFRELNYAAYKLSPKNVFVVVLEKEMTKRENWADVLQFLFASDMYFDLSGATKSGDGWDYSATKAWSGLLEKLKGNGMVPVEPHDTASKESDPEVRESVTTDSVHSIGIKQSETDTTPPPLEAKESDSEVLVHSIPAEASDTGKLEHLVEVKVSMTPMSSDTINNEFSGFSAQTIFLGLAVVCVVVGFGLYQRNMVRK